MAYALAGETKTSLDVFEFKIGMFPDDLFRTHTIGKQLAYAWVPSELSTQGTNLSIRYFDKDYPATVGQDPQFDPQMTRLRS